MLYFNVVTLGNAYSKGLKIAKDAGLKSVAKNFIIDGSIQVSLGLTGLVLSENGVSPELVLLFNIIGSIVANKAVDKITKAPSGLDDLAKGASIDDIVKKTGLPEDKIDDLLKKSGMSLDDLSDALKTNSYDDILRKLNPQTRLPRTDGHWVGDPGNGLWYSDNPIVNAITNGEGIPFKNGRPDFSAWNKGSIHFNPGVLDGTSKDFTEVYKQIKKDYNLPSQKAAEELLNSMGLTPHHFSTTEIQLIPTNLHGNIPHIGTASDLRGVK